MARYGKEHKQATRRRIVETAGRRLKRDGIDGSGVSTLMAPWPGSNATAREAEPTGQVRWAITAGG